MKNEQDRHRIETTVRDCLLRAWKNSMEMARDFEGYSHEFSKSEPYNKIFSKFAVDKAAHATQLRELLHIYQHEHNDKSPL